MWYNNEWWKPISEKITFACTESQLLQVLIGSIGVVPDGYFVLENQTAETFSGRVSKFTRIYHFYFIQYFPHRHQCLSLMSTKDNSNSLNMMD